MACCSHSKLNFYLHNNSIFISYVFLAMLLATICTQLILRLITHLQITTYKSVMMEPF